MTIFAFSLVLDSSHSQPKALGRLELQVPGPGSEDWDFRSWVGNFSGIFSRIR